MIQTHSAAYAAVWKVLIPYLAGNDPDEKKSKVVVDVGVLIPYLAGNDPDR